MNDKFNLEKTKYTLYKREHPGYDFEEYGTYDLSTKQGFTELVKAVFDFGRWMYDAAKLIPVDTDCGAKEIYLSTM